MLVGPHLSDFSTIKNKIFSLLCSLVYEKVSIRKGLAPVVVLNVWKKNTFSESIMERRVQIILSVHRLLVKRYAIQRDNMSL